MTTLEDLAPPALDVADELAPAIPAGLFRDGGAFILDAPACPEPVWGRGSEVLWSRGEALIVTGSIGAGKTTLLAALLRARLGLVDEVLGFPVAPGGRVMYLASDRPRQIGRNLRRLFHEDERDALSRGLRVWPGPPPMGDLARHPDTLRRMADALRLGEGDTIMVDGIKDVALKLADDETGAGINRAFQLCLRDGIDIVANHHQRKAQGGKGSGKPKDLADVYGSTWITAGAGTVLLLWADQPGSAYVELSTLKPAAEPVGPLQVFHDLDTGRMSLVEAPTVESVLASRPHVLTSVNDLCLALGIDREDRNRRAQVSRTCTRLASAGRLEVTEQPCSGGGRPEKLYRWNGARP